LALTLALGGLQFVWSVETGFGSLYLLSLGMKKSLMSLVWLAGPLSGLITQPLVGALSDSCTSRFGRRRPYIVGSTVGVVVCLAVIGWTREIAGDRPTLVIWLAVAAFYLLDFAINCIQASLRALIVDTLPTSRQDAGTAWASRMIGIGNVAGYLMGFLDLVSLLPLLGSTQLQILTTIASATLAATVSITCYFTPEIPITRASVQAGDGLAALHSIFTSLQSLPRSIKRVCQIQVFSWIGWFPFLFYNTTYVAGLYVASHSSSKGSTALAEGTDLIAEGTRAGSLAMFAYSISSLVFSVILPLFAYSAATRPTSRHRARMRERLSVTLPMMWAISLSIFAAAMLSTLLVSTVRGATMLIALCGFSWAVTIWVPFSIIGETISSTPSSACPLSRRGASGSDGYVARNGPSAGTILGIHNMFIVLPQFLTAFASSLMFAFFEH
ncbi:hypothetical protein GQ54DRAFT_251303, partial [Martensiomyces pterosporus]